MEGEGPGRKEGIKEGEEEEGGEEGKTKADHPQKFTLVSSIQS